MTDSPNFSQNAFANWAAFERELREWLKARVDAETAERVVTRTRSAVENLRLPMVTRSLKPDHAEQARRYEDWTRHQMRILVVLIRSLVALEKKVARGGGN